jgi:hypothetical protein
MLPSNPNLQTLVIKSNSVYSKTHDVPHYVSAQDLSIIFSKLPNLTSVTLEWVTLCSRDIFSRVTEWPKKLHVVCVRYCMIYLPSSKTRRMRIGRGQLNLFHGLPDTVKQIQHDTIEMIHHQGHLYHPTRFCFSHVQDLAVHSLDMDWKKVLRLGALPSVRNIFLHKTDKLWRNLHPACCILCVTSATPDAILDESRPPHCKTLTDWGLKTVVTFHKNGGHLPHKIR